VNFRLFYIIIAIVIPGGFDRLDFKGTVGNLLWHSEREHTSIRISGYANQSLYISIILLQFWSHYGLKNQVYGH
jgi:hypothetical protein